MVHFLVKYVKGADRKKKGKKPTRFGIRAVEEFKN